MAPAGLWAAVAAALAAASLWGRAGAGAASCPAGCLAECWQKCGPLQTNRSVWGALCAADPECAGACRQLCGTASPPPPPPPPPLQAASAPGAEWLARLLAALTQPGGGVRPRTASSAPRRGNAGLLPTIVEIELPPATGPDEARVLVVDPGGPRANLGERHMSRTAAAAAAAVFRGRGTSYDVTYGDAWSVGVASVTQQGVLVFAELSWRAPEGDMAAASRAGGSPLYLVTWEVDGGGITGNLYTDSSCVTLSLWADTVFHVQVELVRHSVSVSRSGSLRIDTSARPGAAAADGSAGGDAAAAKEGEEEEAPSVRAQRLGARDAWLLPALPNAAAAAAAFLAAACWRVRRRHRRRQKSASKAEAGAARLHPSGPDDLCV